MASKRPDPGAPGYRRSVTHVAHWVVAIVVPVVAGGIVGGPLGGVVTAALIIPWLDHLLRRRTAQPETRDPVGVRLVHVGGEAVDARADHRASPTPRRAA